MVTTRRKVLPSQESIAFASRLRWAHVVRYSRKGRTGTIENSIRFTRTPFFVWDKKTLGFATKAAQPYLRHLLHMLRSPSAVCLRYDCFLA